VTRGAIARGDVGGEGWWGFGGKARTGEQGGQQVATHPLSRFVTLGAPSAPCPVLVMALPLECVCAFFFACVSFPMMCHDAHAALAGEGGGAPPSTLPSGEVDGLL
jgi:hypothetical protein